MYLSLMMSVFGHLSLDDALDELVRLRIPAAEVGTGGYPGDAHCRPAELLTDPGALADFRRSFEDRGLRISALACHGNPLHPDPAVGKEHHRVFQDTVRLAQDLGIDRLVLFSGCPGGSPSAEEPNWVTCAWPTDYLRILEWQWQEKVIPYWQEQAAFATGHGVTRLAFEMHPGFVVSTRQRFCACARRSGRPSERISTRVTCSGRASTRSPPSANWVRLERCSTPTPRTRR